MILGPWKRSSAARHVRLMSVEKVARSAGRQYRPSGNLITLGCQAEGNYHYLGYVAYGSLRYHFCWLVVLFLAQDDLMLNG